MATTVANLKKKHVSTYRRKQIEMEASLCKHVLYDGSGNGKAVRRETGDLTDAYAMAA